ncbi:hypothetical protein J6590_108138, partial [Homalodisca vitripennis]
QWQTFLRNLPQPWLHHTDKVITAQQLSHDTFYLNGYIYTIELQTVDNKKFEEGNNITLSLTNC